MAKTNRQESRTPEEVYQKVFKDVSRILDPNEDYIYRGEDEQFDRPCASSLYRESKKVLQGDSKIPDEPLEEVVAKLSKWNRERLIKEIRAYYPDTTDNERLAAVQHLGGATNFVDFSEDLNVALFFACYKNPDKKGRIIVMPSSKNDRESTSTSKKDDLTNLELLKENKTFIPRRTGSDPGYQRARAQKGLVVYCPEGYIKEDKYKTVGIASQDKSSILEYLRKYHGIDYQTIFYDVHGYIELTKYRHALLREYVIAAGRMNYGDAEKRISELINMGGTYWEYNERGVLYGGQGDHTRAISDYDQAIKLNPEDSEAYNNRGIAYNSLGNYDLAILDYDQALKLNPEDSEVYNNRGDAYSSQGDYSRAILDLSHAIKLNPNLSQAHYNRGNAYHFKGDHTRAISDYTEAIRLNSEYVDAYNNRGNSYRFKGDHARAISDYTKAIKLNSEYGRAYYNRGNIHGSQGDYSRAILDYTEAIRINPKDAVSYYSRGLALIAEDKPKRDEKNYGIQAKKDYLRAVELNSEFGTPERRAPFETYL